MNRIVLTVLAAALATDAAAQNERAKAASSDGLREAFENIRGRVIAPADATYAALRDGKRDTSLPMEWKVAGGLLYAALHIPAPVLFVADFLALAAACSNGPTQPGTPPSTPPLNPCPHGPDVTSASCTPYAYVAGRGSDGAAGGPSENGREGGEGQPGRSITVVIGRVQTASGNEGIQVVVDGAAHFLGSEPVKAIIQARGGPGGHGGRGGNGSSTSCPGKGGRGGSGGKGGTITVYTTDPALLSWLDLRVPGGDGGQGGSGGEKYYGTSGEQGSFCSNGEAGAAGLRGPMGSIIHNTLVPSP